MATDLAHFGRLQVYLSKVSTIKTGSALAEATVEVSKPLGLYTLMCGALKIHGDKVDGRFYFGNWSTEWTQTYMESVFANDPIVSEARRRIAPFTWDELLADDDFGQIWRDLIEKGRQAGGWTGGFAVPIHGPGSYVGLMSFAGIPLELTAPRRAILLALAHAAHQRGREIYAPEKGAPPKLTSRERQVMRWIANGKTDQEIAGILAISATTVHSYAEQAKRKLGARSRSQAVNEMALYSLL